MISEKDEKGQANYVIVPMAVPKESFILLTKIAAKRGMSASKVLADKLTKLLDEFAKEIEGDDS